MFELTSSILTAVSDAFGGDGTPWIVGVKALAVIVTFAVGGPILYWITRRRSDPASELGKAVRNGQVGEEIGGEEDESPFLHRHIVEWIGDGRVVAIDAYGRPFVGQVVMKKPSWWRDEIWALVQKEDSHRSVWCRLPAPI